MLSKNTTSKLLLGLYLSIVLIGCDPNYSPEKSYGFDHYFGLTMNGESFSAQLAISDKELSNGLMFRKELEKDQGMLFVFESPKRASFWMKNTSIPLDIGYFDITGRLLEIHQLYPFDPRPIRSKSQQIKYALEMRSGWFKNHNISSGHALDLKKIDTAIQKRK